MQNNKKICCCCRWNCFFLALGQPQKITFSIPYTYQLKKEISIFKFFTHENPNPIPQPFFDEIHKGGSTDNSENILHAFNNHNVVIDIFIMVTATFAKPNVKYASVSFIDKQNKGLRIIEWTYDDQQMMKQVTNTEKQKMIIDSRKELTERVVLTDIFYKY